MTTMDDLVEAQMEHDPFGPFLKRMRQVCSGENSDDSHRLLVDLVNSPLFKDIIKKSYTDGIENMERDMEIWSMITFCKPLVHVAQLTGIACLLSMVIEDLQKKGLPDLMLKIFVELGSRGLIQIKDDKGD